LKIINTSQTSCRDTLIRLKLKRRLKLKFNNKIKIMKENTKNLPNKRIYYKLKKTNKAKS